jgi:soluble lytic murein transglycosylase-like protein
MTYSKFYWLAGWLLACACGSVYAEETASGNQELRQLAEAYEHGRGVKQDYHEAFTLYCKAALAGDSESAYSLGFMYFNGRGVARDPARAARWFKQAADAGDMHAQAMLSRYADVQAASEDPDCKPEPVQEIINIQPNAYWNSPNRQKVQNWVNQIAPRYGIDPELVMAVIGAESGFNLNALSDKNAQGLMQLIPETAERFGVADSWNPVQNIQGGTAYLHWLLRHFNGNVELVLAAYNAGEKNVERYQGIPPFEETQNYVKIIRRHYAKAQHPVPPEKHLPVRVVEQRT